MLRVLPAYKPVYPAFLATLVRQVAPNWFPATMGTGALALVLAQIANAVPALTGPAAGFWLLNIVLFAGLFALYLAQWITRPQQAAAILSQSRASMFLGCIPMGLTTIVNGFIVFGPPLFGRDMSILIAHALWWPNAAMAALVGLAVTFAMITRQHHRLEDVTALLLLPIVASEVAAASAGLLAPHLGADAGYTVLVTGYVLWALSVPLAMAILTVLVLRLILHKLPEREMAASGWLAVGPLGTGALALVLLGRAAPSLFATQGIDGGDILSGLGLVGGLVIWGYGLWWLCLAMLKTLYLRGRQPLPFNLGWWGFTFPLGVFCLAGFALAEGLKAPALWWLTAALSLLLTGLWTAVAARTLALAVNAMRQTPITTNPNAQPSAQMQRW